MMAPLALAALLAAGPLAACGPGIAAGDFPGVLVIEIDRAEIGIGSVAPFAGGKGRIVVRAGPLRDGISRLQVEQGDFSMDEFSFPYLWINWKTRLLAVSAGSGMAAIDPAGGRGDLRLDIGLEAENPLGEVRFAAVFTTGKSPPVTIHGRDYRPTGKPLDLADGDAVIVATGKTSADSHFLFRNDDFYARAEICAYFRQTGGPP